MKEKKKLAENRHGEAGGRLSVMHGNLAGRIDRIAEMCRDLAEQFEKLTAYTEIFPVKTADFLRVQKHFRRFGDTCIYNMQAPHRCRQTWDCSKSPSHRHCESPSHRHCESPSCRHCERSEAIQNTVNHWIASGCAIAMTGLDPFETPSASRHCRQTCIYNMLAFRCCRQACIYYTEVSRSFREAYMYYMQASRSSRRIFPDIGKHFRSFRTFRACGSFSGNSGSPSTHAETLPTHPAALRPCAETLPTHPADFRLCAETFPGSPADFRPRAETFPKHPADFRPCAETFPKRPADFRLCTETFPNGSADFPLVRKSFRADCFAERQRSRVGFAFCGDFACSVSAPDSQDSPDSPGAQLFRGDVSVGSRIAVVLNYAVRSINMLILAVLAAVAVSCGSDIPDSTPAPSPLNDSIIASLPKTVVHSREISRELRLNGRIVPDETRQANVYALVSGRAGQIGVELGDRVRKNQTLAVLKSAEVAAVSSELATAGSNLEIARKNREVYGELYGSGLASVREHASAVAEYEKALSELRKAEDVAAITGGENSFCRLVSPIDGYICAKNITGNSEVRSDMADPLFSIADLSVVWIIVDVYEADIASVRNGQAASVHTLSNPDRIYESKIDRIYSVLDPETRTMKARISLANSDGSLMPGMFASVKLKINESRTAVAVPSKSLVFENGRMYVIVMNGDGCPEIRPVREILRSDETSYLEGIADGETVITGSQIFLFEILNFEF